MVTSFWGKILGRWYCWKKGVGCCGWDGAPFLLTISLLGAVMVYSCCGGPVEELHGSAGHDRKEFFWLDEICCPECSLDLPYPPSLFFCTLSAVASPGGRAEPKPPALERRASKVKGVVKERKIIVWCWFVLLPLLQEWSLLPCQKSPKAFPGGGRLIFLLCG